jgi:hypothetical protein
VKPRKKRRNKKKPTLKRAAKSLAKILYKYLIDLPEKEREKGIAALERAVSKKLRHVRPKK